VASKPREAFELRPACRRFWVEANEKAGASSAHYSKSFARSLGPAVLWAYSIFVSHKFRRPIYGSSSHDHPHGPAEHHGHTHAHSHSHAHDQHHDDEGSHESRRTVQVRQAILSKSDQLAERNRGFFHARGLFVLNVLSSPGSGKTTFLQETVRSLDKRLKSGFISGLNAVFRVKPRGTYCKTP
jgi:hypothetical protein